MRAQLEDPTPPTDGCEHERIANLIRDPAEAQEIFGEDELEQHAEELRRRGEL